MPTITQTMSISVSSNESSAAAGALDDTGDSAILIDVTLPALVTDVQDIACSFLKNDLQSIFLVCSTDVELSFTGGSATINLKAKQPFLWGRSNGYTANPFSNNVTGIVAATTEGGRLQGRVLIL